jgi:cytosine/adenosine deaminase-related metal-dependent hydrolase
MHWSETLEELEWMLHGRGPFAELLSDSPRLSGLDWIERAGLLRPGLSLVHGNLPQAGEPERLAARGVALVHCPGSHAFFEREPFPLDPYRRAGVTLALGTDSLASNSALDMGRELRLLRASAPSLSPAEAWELATLGGARALGLAGQVGELAPGARADFAVFELGEAGAEASLDALTAAEPRPAEVWIGGRPVLDEAC